MSTLGSFTQLCRPSTNPALFDLNPTLHIGGGWINSFIQTFIHCGGIRKRRAEACHGIGQTGRRGTDELLFLTAYTYVCPNFGKLSRFFDTQTRPVLQRNSRGVPARCGELS